MRRAFFSEGLALVLEAGLHVGKRGRLMDRIEGKREVEVRERGRPSVHTICLFVPSSCNQRHKLQHYASIYLCCHSTSRL